MRPSRRAMMPAISIGAAVTSQTRWPWSRCSWARARVPGQIRVAIASSKISSPSCSSSSTVWPSMKARADAWASATWSGSSDADHAELGLLPRGRRDLPRREEAPAVEPPGQVEDARALHQGVVDVEERGDLRVGRRGQGVLDLGRGRGRLAGHRGPALEVEPTGCGHSTSLPRLCGSPAGHGTPVEPWTDVPGQRPRHVGGAARAHPGRRPGGAGGRPRRRPGRPRGDLGTPSDLGRSRPRGRPGGHRTGRRGHGGRASGCCWRWATASSS